jgi:hypothetical protein
MKNQHTPIDEETGTPKDSITINYMWLIGRWGKTLSIFGAIGALLMMALALLLFFFPFEKVYGDKLDYISLPSLCVFFFIYSIIGSSIAASLGSFSSKAKNKFSKMDNKQATHFIKSLTLIFPLLHIFNIVFITVALFGGLLVMHIMTNAL